MISLGSSDCKGFPARRRDTMVVRLRLARFGRKNRPFYRIVAIDSRKARQGRALEQVRPSPPDNP